MLNVDPLVLKWPQLPKAPNGTGIFLYLYPGFVSTYIVGIVPKDERLLDMLPRPVP